MLDGVVFLSGYTERAKAYAQAMAAAKLIPALTVLYGQPLAGKLGQHAGSLASSVVRSEIFLPDLSQSLDATLEANNWTRTALSVDGVNDIKITERVLQAAPRLIIFCGYGGELVKDGLLKIAPVLHIHSGWLPDYRGSTTAYYSWLERDVLGASAILLDREIDTGSILMKREYPKPPAQVDMDFLWDSAIRADLLVRVLDQYFSSGRLPESERQNPDLGRTFYVVHPVLKHIALLSPRAPAVQPRQVEVEPRE